jgi:hypothetical protein
LDLEILRNKDVLVKLLKNDNFNKPFCENYLFYAHTNLLEYFKFLAKQYQYRLGNFYCGIELENSVNKILVTEKPGGIVSIQYNLHSGNKEILLNHSNVVDFYQRLLQRSSLDIISEREGDPVSVNEWINLEGLENVLNAISQIESEIEDRRYGATGYAHGKRISAEYYKGFLVLRDATQKLLPFIYQFGTVAYELRNPNDGSSAKSVQAKVNPYAIDTDEPDVKEVITITGFDAAGEPEIRVMDDDSLYVVFNFMPPYSAGGADIDLNEFESFDKYLEKELGIDVVWEDREIFFIEKPKKDTAVKLKNILENFWENKI